MKIDTNKNITASMPQRSGVAYVNRGSEWHYRWLSWLMLSLCLVFASNAQAFKFPSFKIPHPNDVSKCGGMGQRACHVWEAVPTCDSGLAQDHIKQTCGRDVVGEFLEKAVKDTGKTILNTGETVGKFTAEQGKKALTEAEKGLAEAGKALEGVAAEAYKGAAELFLGQVKKPLEDMAKAWKDSINRKPQGFSALKSAIQKGDGAAINAALKQMLDDMIANSSFGLFAQDLKDKNAGSFLVVVSAGGGAGITAHGDIGIAIDIDYLIHVSKTGKSSGFEGPIASLFTVAGLQIGPAAGGGVDVVFGYHVADPNGVNGPSMDLSLEVKLAIGGSVGAGMDMTKAPWKFNTAGIGLGAGAELKFAAGPSAGFIMGQLCGNGKFVPLVRDCPSTTAGTGTGTETANSPTVSVAMDCISKYAKANTCDWSHWSEMYSACKIETVPELKNNNFLLNKVKGGQCTWNNWTNLYNEATGKTPATSSSGFKASLKNVHSNKCMDAEGGGNVIQWDCHSGPNQRMTFTPVTGKSDVYSIKFEHSGKCLDVVDWDGNGANATQYTCHNGANQQFKLQALGGDSYQIIPQHIKGRGRLLDVENGSTNNGASVFTWPANNYPSQKWLMIKDL